MTPPVGNGDNPNQFFAFAFGDEDLRFFVPQRFLRSFQSDHRWTLPESALVFAALAFAASRVAAPHARR